ncbi:flavodoxin family protein [Chloroflexota bacterium]
MNMKVLAINGSARENGNSATMLKHAVNGSKETGAETKLVNLYELKYKGCTGCVKCKLLDGKSFGSCAQRDDLTPVLEEAIDSDVLLLASPIYFNDVTGTLRSFLERFWFPTLTYTKESKFLYPRRIKVGMIFTTNAPSDFYSEFYDSMVRTSSRIIGDTEYVAAAETWQFDDYSKYAASMFDVEARKHRRKEVFPQECRVAYEMGKRLATVT